MREEPAIVALKEMRLFYWLLFDFKIFLKKRNVLKKLTEWIL